MRSRVTFLHHPLHPMLVMIPVALFPLLLILDVVTVYAAVDVPGLWRAGFLTAAIAGVVTLVAIVPGIVDYMAIQRGSQARRTATTHFVFGIALLLLYAVTLYLRWPIGTIPPSPNAVLAVDALGTIGVMAQGWLGGQLVYHHHVGVDAPAEGGKPAELREGPSVHVPPPAARRRPLR